MSDFFYEISIIITIGLVFRFVNEVHRKVYMNGEMKADGSKVFNKHIVYELFSVLTLLAILGLLIYVGHYEKKPAFFILFIILLFPFSKAVFHIVGNIRTEIIVMDDKMIITTGEGERTELAPTSIRFSVEEEDETWYRWRKLKHHCMSIRYGENQNYWFNFNTNNVVDYSGHLVQECKRRYDIDIDVEDGFVNEMGISELAVFLVIALIGWSIYFGVVFWG
jgi:hypothetical protein